MILALLLPATASAQTAEDRNRAQQKATEGAAMAEQGKHAQALKLFQEAYQLNPSPGYRYNLGIAHEALGDDLAALRELEGFLDAAQKVAPEFIADAVARARDIRTRIVLIEVRSSQDGATVMLDGQEAGRTPLRRSLRARAGVHRVEVSKAGFAAFEKELVAQPGEELELQAVLRTATDPAGGDSLGQVKVVRKASEGPPSVVAPSSPLAGGDLAASLGVDHWMAGVKGGRSANSPALHIAAGYVPASLATHRFAFRAGLAASGISIDEKDARTIWYSFLAVPGLRLALGGALSASADLGVGLLVISNPQPGGFLLPVDRAVKGGALTALELRPGLGLGYALTPALGIFVSAGLAWNRKPALIQDHLLRLDLGAGLRWQL